MARENGDTTAQKGGSDRWDIVTGLPSFTAFLDALYDSTWYERKGTQYFIFINIPKFKIFNQNYGFASGDEYLAGVAKELAKVFSDGLVCRVHSDHFVVQVFEKDRDSVVARIDQVSRSIVTYERALHMGIKAGIYENQAQGRNTTYMIDCAHLACDSIMQSYAKDISFYDEHAAHKLMFERYIITHFDDALEQGYIMPYYQRIVRTLTGRVCGYEALARWHDPTYDIVTPATFVPLLEDAHLIHKLDLYITQHVCADLRKILDDGYSPQPVSINFSRLDFQLCDIFAEVQSLRTHYDLPSDLINIEITESAFAEASDALIKTLHQFNQAGYEIWMDDFGSGYSSLNNLQKYKFDLVKIDMAFLAALENNPRTRVILSSVVSMAAELGIHTLAEGIETKEQYEFIRSIGCGCLQGFYFGRPLAYECSDKNGPIFLRDDRPPKLAPEQSSQRKYYETIGNINVVGSSPLQPHEMRVYSNIAFAIIEIEDDTISYLYANDAYIELLHSIDIDSLEMASAHHNADGLQENAAFSRLAAQCEASGKIEKSEFIVNGKICSSQLRFIARSKSCAAFAIITQNLSEYGAIQQAEDIEVAMHYVLTLFFRVDLYDEDGTVENIYLESAQQGRITDEETNAVEAVRMYSHRYLPEDERERFRHFYDMTTVRARLAEIGGEFLSDCYHSNLPGEQGRIQMYTILPFNFHGHWKALSCCRYIDDFDTICAIDKKSD